MDRSLKDRLKLAAGLFGGKRRERRLSNVMKYRGGLLDFGFPLASRGASGSSCFDGLGIFIAGLSNAHGEAMTLEFFFRRVEVGRGEMAARSFSNADPGNARLGKRFKFAFRDAKFEFGFQAHATTARANR